MREKYSAQVYIFNLYLLLDSRFRRKNKLPISNNCRLLFLPDAFVHFLHSLQETPKIFEKFLGLRKPFQSINNLKQLKQLYLMMIFEQVQLLHPIRFGQY